jgi:hypothetical protein
MNFSVTGSKVGIRAIQYFLSYQNILNFLSPVKGFLAATAPAAAEGGEGLVWTSHPGWRGEEGRGLWLLSFSFVDVSPGATK